MNYNCILLLNELIGNVNETLSIEFNLPNEMNQE